VLDAEDASNQYRHVHYLPDFYREALQANGHAKPDGMPRVPDVSSFPKTSANRKSLEFREIQNILEQFGTFTKLPQIIQNYCKKHD
jgi:hypothetical protein